MPIEPGPARWQFPALGPDHGDLIAVGGDLGPSTLLAAYRQGLFPMPTPDPEDPDRAVLGWWSPVARGVLGLEDLRVSRSLRQSARRYRTRVDTAFAEVVAGCADPSRPGGWIDDSIAGAYQRLHELGWAHSVETWDGDRLVGGLYGVAVGGLFAGESMFSIERDASKVALVRLVELLGEGGPGPRIIDAQWRTDHLASLGVAEIPRADYLALLKRVLATDLPPAFAAVAD